VMVSFIRLIDISPLHGSFGSVSPPGDILES
jgi:hypothetical protein